MEKADYFKTPLWVEYKPEFVKNLDKASNKYIKEARKRDKERIYGKTFLNLINPYLKNLSKLINATEFNLQNYWFQQYEKGSKHDWHIHPNLNYTGVYYLEYPDLKVKTELYDFVTKCIINIKKIKEGDVLIFPSNIIHRAPEVKDNKRKTIISFNMDFTMFDFKKIKNIIAKKKG